MTFRPSDGESQSALVWEAYEETSTLKNTSLAPMRGWTKHVPPWVIWEVECETRISVQVVYLGCDPMKHRRESRTNETGKKEKLI